jgi:MFS family permease
MDAHHHSYKWIALSNTTLGAFMATMSGSIVIISLPAIFRGINLDPLEPANINYLLWILMGYLVCTAVLVVAFGRLGDILGRVRMYNAGFAIFTITSIALSLTPGQGSSAAMYMIVWRMLQGIGGALLMANSTAILFDVFPLNQRGMAMGINSIAVTAGQFLGLIAGGFLADWHWRMVFLINVPVGLFGTVWAYLKLRDTGEKVSGARMDWWGNLTFAFGLIAILIAITYGIQPYKNHVMAWTSPVVIAELIAGLVFLMIFVFIEREVMHPMFNLKLFKIKAFSAGNAANLLAAIGRGGLQFMLILWLQGIWLPLHGYSFESTPLWAGIYMLPLTAGFLISGPLAGYLSDKYSPRMFATGGMVIGAVSFGLLMILPADFSYHWFALLIFINGIGSGLFIPPNSTLIMNAAPANQRGQASGMRATFMNSGQVLSIGLFFSLLIFGFSAGLPTVMQRDLIQQQVPAAIAAQAANTPAVASLFAAFLGYNPIAQLIPASALHALPSKNALYITGKTFFPNLISGPFVQGLRFAFTLSLGLYILAAVASLVKERKIAHCYDKAVYKDKAEAIEELLIK